MLRSRMLRLVVLSALCAALAACGGDDDDSAESADEPETTTTRAPETVTTSDSESTSPPATAGAEDVWRQTASEYRGRDGERFTITCTPDGQEDAIWGVETYTDDSSICTAAVHVGLITFEDGGEVEYEIAPGLDEYESAIGNDVLSSRYPAFQGSFIFPDAPPGSGEFTVGAETWQRTAAEYGRATGERLTLECAPDGTLRGVWGTGTYTSDSGVCAAAVHAGLITLEDGGTVTIEMAPGADSYEGSTANGVTSASFGNYSASFTFPDDQPEN